MKIWKRIRQWRRRAEFEAGLEEEMRFHREMAGGAASPRISVPGPPLPRLPRHEHDCLAQLPRAVPS